MVDANTSSLLRLRAGIGVHVTTQYVDCSCNIVILLLCIQLWPGHMNIMSLQEVELCQRTVRMLEEISDRVNGLIDHHQLNVEQAEPSVIHLVQQLRIVKNTLSSIFVSEF